MIEIALAVLLTLAALLFAVVCDRWYIRFEEARMREVFGADYEAYALATRRWL